MQEGNGELKIPPRQPPGRLSSSLPREEFMKLRKRRPFCRFPPAKDKSVELWKSLDAAAVIFALAFFLIVEKGQLKSFHYRIPFNATEFQNQT